jgi:transcriptional regulator with XRE-family HTH domain
MEQVIKKLREYKSLTPSKWREEAEYRRDNKTWLSHSQHIAMLMLDKMEIFGLTESELAEQIGFTEQYLNNILKGKENISLETLVKIENILHIGVLTPDFSNKETYCNRNYITL